MQTFKELSKMISYVDSVQTERRTMNMFADMSDAFVVILEIEGESLVVTSVVGDSESIIGYSNQEAEKLDFMDYLNLTKDKFIKLMYEMASKGRILKKNKIRKKDGNFVDTFGIIYRTSATTLLEIIIPSTELIDLEK